MLYREIIAVCSPIHTKHINTLCGQNVELLNVKLAVHIVTAGLVGLTTVVHFFELPYQAAVSNSHYLRPSMMLPSPSF